MKSIIGTLCIAALLALTVSCVGDPRIESRERPSAGGVDVRLRLNITGGFARPATRLSIAGESTVGGIRVLVFDRDNTLISIKRDGDIKTEPADGEEGEEGGGGLFVLTLEPSSAATGTCNLVVLANLTGEMESALQNLQPGTGYAEAMAAITGAVPGALYTAGGAIPMWGETGHFAVIPINANQSVTLLRAVARIDIGVGTPALDPDTGEWSWNGLDADGEGIPFTLTDVFVMRPADRMAAVPLAANFSGGRATAVTLPENTAPFSAEASAEKFSFSDGAITGGLYTTRSIYLPESEVVLGGTPRDEHHTDRAAVVVGGLYEGETYYYRVDIAPGGTLKDLLRNHLYRINIVKVLRPGRATPVEAYTYLSDGADIEVEIFNWEEQEMDDIEFTGTKYFQMPVRRVEFTSGGLEDHTLAITTNAPFTLSLAATGDVKLDSADPALHTYSGPDFDYTLTRDEDGGNNYTLTISAKTPNISPVEVDRLETLAIHTPASKLRLPLSVDQTCEPTYVVSNEGRHTVHLYPEGLGEATIPLDIITARDVTVTITGEGGQTDPAWLGGVVPVTTGEEGISSALMKLTVPVFKYGAIFDGTADRTATIVVAVEGEAERRYTITQEAPRVAFNPSPLVFNRPLVPSKLVGTITVETNLLPGDLGMPALGESTADGTERFSLYSEANPAMYDAGIEATPRYRRFDVTVDMETVDPNPVPFGSSGRPVSLAPDAKYGVAASGNVNMSTATGNTFQFWWYRSAYPAGTYQWTVTRYGNTTNNYVFPWNTARVELDIVSDKGLKDVSTTAGKNSGIVTLGEGVTTAGVTRTPVEFDLNYTDYRNARTYTLAFEAETDDKTRVLRSFTRYQQSFSRTDPATYYYDYSARTLSAVTVIHNVNWTATTGKDASNNDITWAKLRIGTSGSFTNTVTQNAGRVTAPATTATSMTKTSTLQLSLDALGLNALSADYRAASVSFTNSDYNSGYGVGHPAAFSVYQYTPKLSHNSYSGLWAEVPAEGMTFTENVLTNLQGWGVRIWVDRLDNGNLPNGVVWANHYSGTSSKTISATSGPGADNIQATIGLYTGNVDRNLRIVLYHPNFPGSEITVANVVQKVKPLRSQFPLNPGHADVLWIDGSGRLQVGKFDNRTVTLRNMIFTRFGSTVGFVAAVEGWSANSVRFNPTNNNTSTYAAIPYSTIEGIYDYYGPGRYGPSVSDQLACHTYDNVRAGRGDICMLAGYTAAEVRNWTREQFETNTRFATWRLPTAVENTRFAGGPAGGVWSTWIDTTGDYYYTNGSANSGTTYHFWRNPVQGATSISDGGSVASPWIISFPVVAQPGRPAFSEHLPAGGQFRDNNGGHVLGGRYAYYWSSTPTWWPYYTYAMAAQPDLHPAQSSGGNYIASDGFAIRCVRVEP